MGFDDADVFFGGFLGCDRSRLVELIWVVALLPRSALSRTPDLIYMADETFVLVSFLCINVIVSAFAF